MNRLNDNEVKFDRNGDLIRIRNNSKNDKNVKINSSNLNASVVFIYDANQGKSDRMGVNPAKRKSVKRLDNNKRAKRK